MGAFTLALCDARFLPDHYASLAETTVRGVVSYVSQTFRENDRPNPTKDDDNELNSNPGTGADMRQFFNKLHW